MVELFFDVAGRFENWNYLRNLLQFIIVKISNWTVRIGWAALEDGLAVMDRKTGQKVQFHFLIFIIELVTFNYSRSQYFVKEAPQIIPGPFSSLLPPTHILSKHFLIHIQQKINSILLGTSTGKQFDWESSHAMVEQYSQTNVFQGRESP